ncbi:MAG TPA: hypothetical protein VIV10_03775 [Gemmatimonadales bacterium]
MESNRVRALNGARVGAGAGVLIGLVVAAVALAIHLPPGPVGVAAAALLGALILPVAASPVEWLVHRYLYHRVLTEPLRPLYRVHHQAHHYLYFPTWRYVTSGPPRRIPLVGAKVADAPTGRWTNRAIEAAHFAFYMALGAGLIVAPFWWLTRRLAFVAGAGVALVVVSYLMIAVHDTIHRPGAHPWIERQRWFAFLDEHHFIHHVDTEANVNFLLPLTDWLFGTLRTALTPDERARHGTRIEAKACPNGAGEPARATGRQDRVGVA